MVMTDFIYAGKRLSDYGFIIANLTSSRSDNITLGSVVSFNTIRNKSNFSQKIINSDYQEDLTPPSFDIIKNPCYNSKITDEEISFIMKWLNRNEYKEFQPIYDDTSFSNVIYKGSFNLEAIVIANEVHGFSLTFVSNSPFGFEKEQIYDFKIVNSNDTFRYINDSDKMGILYPNYMEIKLKANGNLRISNSLERNHTTTINGCLTNEVIHLNCIDKIITSSLPHETLFNDFNYKYPRFTSYESNIMNNVNILSFSLPCEVRLSVSPYRKVGIIV